MFTRGAHVHSICATVLCSQITHAIGIILMNATNKFALISLFAPLRIVHIQNAKPNRDQ